MSLHHHLRLRNAVQTRLELLRDQFQGSQLIDILPDCHYLQLWLSNEHGEKAEAFLDIDMWLQEMDMHLPGIPWQQVPLSYLVRWLNNLELNFLVTDRVWDVRRIVLPSDELPEKLLSLPSQPCPLLCIDWPCHSGERINTGISPGLLPFTLRYVLGRSRLPLSELVELATGDLLLIKDDSPTLSVGPHRLFHMHYSEKNEVIVEEPFIVSQEAFRAEEEILLEWSKLPVDMEFVLDNVTVTLAELEDIRPGAALPVRPGAEQKIRIYLNRKLFAFGELVALEGGGLAVEVNQLNPGAMGDVSQSNAEQ